MQPLKFVENDQCCINPGAGEYCFQEERFGTSKREPRNNNLTRTVFAAKIRGDKRN